MKKYICIDIGGTAMKYGLVDECGKIICRNERKTEAWKGGSGILEKAVEIVENFLKNETICGICISSAGTVDIEAGMILGAPDLVPDYTGTRWKEEMETRFGIPCEVENDVNCAGLAETCSGAAVGSEIVVMLTVGTGIGGSMILGGKIFHGFSGTAGEVGYMHMRGSIFEKLGAVSVLVKKVAERKQDSAENWNGYRIFEEAKAGDAVCIQAIDEMTDVLGEGIANICCMLDPQVVVLGGGIMAQKAFLKERIEDAVKRYLDSELSQHTRIAFAEHGNDAGMLGAFYHFCQRQNKQ